MAPTIPTRQTNEILSPNTKTVAAAIDARNTIAQAIAMRTSASVVRKVDKPPDIFDKHEAYWGLPLLASSRAITVKPH
jgi:hypothetical protein